MHTKQEYSYVCTPLFLRTKFHPFLFSGRPKGGNHFWNLIEQPLILLPGYTRFLCFINSNNVITKTAL